MALDPVHIEPMRWCIFFVVAGAAALACTSGQEAPPSPIQPTGGSAGQPTMATGGVDRAAGGVGGVDVPTGLRCDRCGSTREACAPALTACAADADYSSLLECVYGKSGCALDAGGAECVESCARSACSDPSAVELFLEADRCTYCTPECRDACASYCGALDYGSFACTPSGGGGGAGGLAGKAAGGGGALAAHRAGQAGTE